LSSRGKYAGINRLKQESSALLDASIVCGVLTMRTTLTIGSIAATLKKASQRTGKSFKEVVNETLRVGLAAKGLQLADALKDEEIFRKLKLRK
jgi:hypothetical protein